MSTLDIYGLDDEKTEDWSQRWDDFPESFDFDTDTVCEPENRPKYVEWPPDPPGFIKAYDLESSGRPLLDRRLQLPSPSVFDVWIPGGLSISKEANDGTAGDERRPNPPDSMKVQPYDLESLGPPSSERNQPDSSVFDVWI